MAEYIDKAVAIDIMNSKAEMGVCSEYASCFFAAAKMLELLPAADVAEVRHGKWIAANISGVNHYRCTECGEYIEAVWTANFDYHYYPNCGARMDEEGSIDG